MRDQKEAAREFPIFLFEIISIEKMVGQLSLLYC